MKESLVMVLLLSASVHAYAVDAGAIFGGALGGGVGAAIGQNLGGANGAIVGGAIGGGQSQRYIYAADTTRPSER
jgi:uncharacterized protein YcfJ